ncbi:MAG: hypothetical protein AB1921_10830 [Thermodesulfobacteriota bacterium]
MHALLFTVLGLFFALSVGKLLFVLTVTVALPETGGAMFVPTHQARVAAFLDAVPLDRGKLLVDLGAGDGRVLRAACRRYHVAGLGFELNFLAYACALALSVGVARLHFERKNFLSADLSGADYIYCYLFPDVMEAVGRKLSGELREGVLVASANFPIPDWAPFSVVRPAGELLHDPIYLYRAPGRQPA